MLFYGRKGRKNNYRSLEDLRSLADAPDFGANGNIESRKAVEFKNALLLIAKLESSAALETMAELVRRDIQYSNLSRLIYAGNNQPPMQAHEVLPVPAHCSETLKHEVYLDFSKDCIISRFWQHERLAGAINNIAENGFKFYPNNLTTMWCPKMKIGIVMNGFHHAGVAAIKRAGVIRATEEVDEQALLKHYKTDGEHWIETASGEVKHDVFDVRVAVLFEITRLLTEE